MHSRLQQSQRSWRVRSREDLSAEVSITDQSLLHTPERSRSSDRPQGSRSCFKARVGATGGTTT
eukprot:8943569-Alexandrium_andersonii.AAC.1